MLERGCRREKSSDGTESDYPNSQHGQDEADAKPPPGAQGYWRCGDKLRIE
jgi:hypothetical protein